MRSYAAELPFPVVKEQGEWVVLLGQEDSKLWVSAKLCNADGKIDCEIDKNKLQINEKNAFRIEQTPHTLTVYDNDAKKVFAIHFLNDHAIRLFGDFYSPGGCHVVINESGVQFGHGRSLSSTGLNGTSVVLDVPTEGVAQAPPPSTEEPRNEDLPKAESVALGSNASNSDVGTAMTEAAQAFLASLQPDELAKAAMKFDDPAAARLDEHPQEAAQGLADQRHDARAKDALPQSAPRRPQLVRLRKGRQDHGLGKQSP